MCVPLFGTLWAPSDTPCSDEDSGAEDSGGSYNNLTGKQLQAESVATVRTILDLILESVMMTLAQSLMAIHPHQLSEKAIMQRVVP